MSYYKKNRSDDVFQIVKVHIPRQTVVKLKTIGLDTGRATSRLIAIAVDNELDVETPFNYPCNLPLGEYKEYMYAGEAGLLMTFLQKVSTGIAMESLLLVRRDIGVKSREDLLGAVRELLEKNMIEEFEVVSQKHPYAGSFKKIRLVSPDRKIMKKTRFKTLEGDKTRGIINDEDIER